MSKAKSKPNTVKTDSDKTTQTKSSGRNRQGLKIVGLIVILLIVFVAGKAYGENKQSDVANSKTIRLVTTTSTVAPTPTTTAPKTPPTKEQLQAQTSKAAKTRSVVISSNGHVILSGTVESSTADNLIIKTKNGQLYSFAVGPETRVTGIGSGSAKITDVKKGASVAVTLSVRPDGSFQVRTIRTYKTS